MRRKTRARAAPYQRPAVMKSSSLGPLGECQRARSFWFHGLSALMRKVARAVEMRERAARTRMVAGSRRSMKERRPWGTVMRGAGRGGSAGGLWRTEGERASPDGEAGVEERFCAVRGR